MLSNGYEVASSTQIHQVFSIIKTYRPHLVILDITNKIMDSRELCRLIKLNRATRSLRVIVCSENEETEAQEPQKGAPDDILHKPFGMNILIRKVQLQLAA